MTAGWRTALGAAGVVALAAGVLTLRALTESRHASTGAGTRTIVDVEATTNLEDLGPGLGDLVVAAATTCRIELTAEPIGPVAERRAGGRYRAVLAPALDDTERSRFEGCLEDWRIDHLQIDVVAMRTVGDP